MLRTRGPAIQPIARNRRRGLLAVVIAFAGVLSAASPAGAATAIDTTPGNSSICCLNSNTSNSTLGQTITAPTDSVLKSFGFVLDAPTTVVFRAHVFAWDGTKATGADLYESARTSSPATGARLISFTPGALQLTPGQEYVLFLSTAGESTSSGNAQWSWNAGTNPYPGGRFIYQTSNNNPGSWTSSSWNDLFPNHDSAFKADFGGPASAATDSPSEVTQTGATLHGSANPNGLPTTAFFQYGPSTDYGSTTAEQDVGSGASNVPVSAALRDLAPGSTVHYRMVARSAAGTSFGDDRSFTLQPEPAETPPDTAPPGLTVNTPRSIRRKRLLRRGVTVTQSADEPTSFVDELLGNARPGSVRRVAASAYNLTLVRRTLPLGSGSRRIRLRPNRKLIGRARRFRLQVRVTAIDASGNRTVARRTIRVR